MEESDPWAQVVVFGTELERDDADFDWLHAAGRQRVGWLHILSPEIIQGSAY
jgi:hypothetical protein